MAQAQPRQKYHSECEAGVNKHINMELYASYVYQSMAFYFNRDDTVVPGLHKYFKKCSENARENAHKLMLLQNQRGGRIVYQTIAKPERDEWGSGLDAMQGALSIEKKVNQALLELHRLGENHNDPQFCDFLENHYLSEKTELMKQMADYVSQLNRCGPGLGEFLFDKETLGE